MVNHFRTLFLNEAQADAENEQYIDANFAPMDLSVEEALVRGLIIREEFPRAYRNYVATLMTRLAYSGLRTSLLDEIDTRSTIDLTTNQVDSLLTRVQLFRDNQAAALNLVGTYTPDLNKGVFREEYNIQDSGGNNVLITNTRTGKQRTQAVTFSNGATDLYRLDLERPLSFQLIGVNSVPTGMFARAAAFTSMSYDVLAALARLKSNDRVDNLFLSVESGAQLRDDFNNAYLPQQQLSAVLIAYALSLTKRLPSNQ